MRGLFPRWGEACLNGGPWFHFGARLYIAGVAIVLYI